MDTNTLNIKMFDTVEEAPTYREPEYKAAGFNSAVIVGKGTLAGNATVDLIFMDTKGQKFIAMTTGNILRSLVAAIDGVEQR